VEWASQTPTQLGLDPRLDAAGINLAGAMSPLRYDALVSPGWRAVEVAPGLRVRSVVLLASGGPTFFRAFARVRGSFAQTRDPLDAYTRRLVGGALAGEDALAAYPFERRAGEHADFVALGREAGLGSPSRLGVLVHPRYGPWFALRALVFCERETMAPQGPLDFAPCEGCPAPCETACHGAALIGERFDVAACATTRRQEPACALRCDARRACVFGTSCAYDAEAEAHHMAAIEG